MGDIAAQAEVIATSGADGAKGPQERQAFAVEVDNFLNEIVDLVNARNDGRHVFGGRETLTAPLIVTRNAQNQITAATWNPRGVDGTVDVEIGDGITMPVNVGGTAVLGTDASPTFLPALLVSLRDAFAANDQAAVSALLNPLAFATRRLAGPVSDTGARQRQVQHALESLDAEELGVRAALSSIVDTDVARATLELSQQEVVYQAALQAAARAIQPTLLDFLR
jgi:flagellar hook-associated protein 3 FlgL